jgi:hypothetical protein
VEEMFAIVVRNEAKVISYSISNTKEIDDSSNISICGVDDYEQGKRISLIYNRMRELGIRANLSNIYLALKNRQQEI